MGSGHFFRAQRVERGPGFALAVLTSTPIAGIRVAKQWRRRNTPFSVFALNPAARMSADGPRTSAAVIAAISISHSAGAMCLRYWPRQVRSDEGFAPIFAQRRLFCRGRARASAQRRPWA